VTWILEEKERQRRLMEELTLDLQEEIERELHRQYYNNMLTMLLTDAYISQARGNSIGRKGEGKKD
jgi:hypothetical protein